MDFTDPQPSFIRRHWLLVCIGTLAALGLAVWAVSFFSSPKKPAPQKQDFSFVQISLPPPPPPPPPPREEPQPRPDEMPDNPRDMIAQEPLAADQPESPPEEAPAQAEATMGTNVQSDGPADGFGLVGRGSGGIIGGGGTLGGQGRGGNRSPWGWYAAQIQRSVEDAIKKNEKTRAAALQITVRVWPDSNGRIERAQLSRSTGDAELDKILTSEILTGIQLRDAPPTDMPLPITLRITAQRPH